MEKHKEKGFDIESEVLRINALTYPYYLESLKKMKITEFIDVTDMTEQQIYDKIFDTIMELIKENVYAKKPHKKENRAFREISEGSTQLDDEYYATYMHDDI